MDKVQQSIDAILQHHASQTNKTLDALSQLTNWMNEVQQSIDNIDKRLKLVEKTNKFQDKESEFYVTKKDFKKDMDKLHKFTEEYCDSVQQGDFYN